MKMTLCVLVFVCLSGTAFGQIGGAGISAEPVVYDFTSHQGHASQSDLGQQQQIMEHFENVRAHGVRPLWEFGSPTKVVPLGDSARILKQEHMSAKKAEIVWNN